MIKIYDKGESINEILNRTQFENERVNETVAGVLQRVKNEGDSALFDYAKQFDGSVLTKDTIKLTKQEIDLAYAEISEEVLASVRRAIKNVLDYHKQQLLEDKMLGKDGKNVGWVMRPVQRAGVYIPGGTAAYPSTAIMNILPAVAAGVKEIIMVTPFKNNKTNPLTVVTAVECGVTEIYKVGGSQAIAALAYGTESINKVDIITGPGNIYVTMAKKQVYGLVGIDMIAGPSEILIIADETANPKFVAADLLSQAEHDKLAASILITTSKALAEKVKVEVERQAGYLERKEIISESLRDNSGIIVVDNIDEAFEISNRIAPEHLEICVENPESYLDKVFNAGAVFMGNYSPEPLGDYYAGPNHTLPTSGSAKYFQVLSTTTFLKRISVINYNFTSLSDAKDDIINLAESEGFFAHANSIKVRFED